MLYLERSEVAISELCRTNSVNGYYCSSAFVEFVVLHFGREKVSRLAVSTLEKKCV